MLRTLTTVALGLAILAGGATSALAQSPQERRRAAALARLHSLLQEAQQRLAAQRAAYRGRLGGSRYLPDSTKNPANPYRGSIALEKTIGSLELYAEDGAYLGRLGSKYESDSVNNPYSIYGSKYGANSTRNPYGVYGSPYSALSPNNPYSTTPPKIYSGLGAGAYSVPSTGLPGLGLSPVALPRLAVPSVAAPSVSLPRLPTLPGCC